MKEFCFALLLSFLFKLSFSQCRITGTIVSKNQYTPELIFLYADGHYEVPSIKLPTNGTGKIDIKLDITKPVFALLKVNDWSLRLLLSPNRNLHINFKTDNEEVVSFSGTAAVENNLVRNSILDSIPFFMKDGSPENPFAKTPLSEWKTKITDPMVKQISIASEKINNANIPSSLKKLLISETNYAWQCHLNDLTNNSMGWAKNADRDTLLDLAMHRMERPDSSLLVSGFYANMILDRQIQYYINKPAQEAKRRKEKVQDVISALFRMPFSEIDSLVKVYGERYLIDWIYAKNYLPVSVQDKILLNKILNAASNASFNTCFYLMDTMSFYFPNSPYLSVAKNEVALIEKRLRPKNQNDNIRFRQPGSVSSMNELIKPYAGKIVYLDIWGTWCGPCKIEMKYVHELKKKFKGRDIVFVYLDMDDNLRDASWKEYLTYYGIEGEHYRMTNEEIQSIWTEIKKEGGTTGRYPTYVLFDRKGKIITPEAERPSSREKLYLQLDKVL